MKCNCQTATYITSALMLVLGIGLVIIAIAGPSIIQSKLDQGLKDQLIVDSEKSSGYKAWVNNSQSDSVPQYQNFYLFNITNPDAVIQGVEKPHLVQVGPYSYRKYDNKFRIQFVDDAKSVSYKTYTYFILDQSKTVGNPYEDIVTTVNIPFQAAEAGIGNDWYQQLAFDLIVSGTNSSIFTTKKVHELLFGYEDPLLVFLAGLQPGTPTVFQLQVNQTSFETADNTTLWDTLGTGKGSLKNIKVYSKFQNQAYLKFWGTEEANRVTGTDGTAFAPNVKNSDKLVAFVDTAFRTALLKYQKDVNLYGVHLKRFVLDEVNFMNETEYPANAAYYQFGPSGVGNMTSTAQGTPLFLSQPHFLNCDPSYLAGVDGLSPNVELHDTCIDVEPISGTTMRAVKRLQINILVDQVLLLYPNIKRTYIPVGWIEIAATITPDLAKQFASAVYGAEDMKRYSKLVGWIVGPILTVLAIVIPIVVYRRSQKRRSDYIPIDINE